MVVLPPFHWGLQLLLLLLLVLLLLQSHARWVWCCWQQHRNW